MYLVLCNSGYIPFSLPLHALTFTWRVSLWYPGGVTISVWGDSEGSTAHSRRQPKNDRSNKKQCITSYQSLNQPFHPRPLPPSTPPSVSHLSPRSPSFPLRRPQPTNRAAPVLLGTQRSVFTGHYASLLNKRKRWHISRPPCGSINKEGLGSLAV